MDLFKHTAAKLKLACADIQGCFPALSKLEQAL
jgi:hypothetical protein